MNTELIIKAVNAVMDFNNIDRDYNDQSTIKSARVEISDSDVCCAIYWGWDGSRYKETFNNYATTDEEIEQFIDKLQELSQ